MRDRGSSSRRRIEARTKLAYARPFVAMARSVKSESSDGRRAMRCAKAANRYGLALLPWTFAACASLNPHRLDDTLAAFHDDLRWGRPEWAERSMASAVRADFNARHAQWATRIRIADLEVEPPRSRDGRTIVRARYVWSFIDEVEQRETIVETRWNAGAMDWTCDQERVVSGDPRLFEPARSSQPSGTRAGGEADSRSMK
jgi:hypothetical protein